MRFGGRFAPFRQPEFYGAAQYLEDMRISMIETDRCKGL
jgi:hypothetical protein